MTLPLHSHPLLSARKRIREDRFAFPDLAPMLDVVFLLVIFFVLNYTASSEKFLRLTLPRADHAQSGNIKDERLLIDANGVFLFEGHRYATLEELKPRLSSLPKERPVILSADARVPYQKIINAFEALGSAGISKVYLNTDAAAETTGATP